jgi:hypothetical protein
LTKQAKSLRWQKRKKQNKNASQDIISILTIEFPKSKRGKARKGRYIPLFLFNIVPMFN